jgi:two-component system chemotaxis response regulator CheB
MAASVLIVDDSAFFRKRLCEILASVSEIEVVGTASNGKEAVEQAAKLKPDVITMDYEMPVMDGITAIKLIMKDNPCPILMFSSLTYEGARVTLDALEAGAVDFLPKNFEDISRDATKMQDVLKSRILSIARKSSRSSVSSSPAKGAATKPLASPPETTAARTAARPTVQPAAIRQASSAETSAPARSSARSKSASLSHPVDLLLIGTSTGGPVALQKIITKLPSSFPVPILLIQHMPATFTPAFAERLNSLSSISVKQAEEGDQLSPGCAYLAPGGMQMLVGKRGGRASLSVIDSDPRLTYKPSVDVTFGSASKAFPGRILSIVLTGMGADGKEGCRMLKAGGSTVWTQTENSCVVYGMPMAVDKAGYSDQSLHIDEIADQLINRLC